jgi:NAD(P)-dependent dehydrogenase (short-subunit alcohol dehydrogenase family)
MGKATALRLLAEGAEVIAADVDARGLDEVRDAGAEVVVADLSDPAGRALLVTAALRSPLHYLVNAAAILHPRPFWDVTEADFRRVFGVNLESVWFLSQALGRELADRGAIINFSSPSARLAGTLEAAVYAATKTAIQSATRSFAYALAARGIRVNAIAPGITDTPMQEQVLREVSALRGIPRERLEEQRLSIVPLGRTAPAEELAGVVVWLLSDEAAYITGQCIYVDGGYIMSA